MDPLTQGSLGAALPQALRRKKTLLGIAGVLGFLSGMAPDLDTFIRSDTDPLLFLEYHRQFTHALIFIPIGGLICALVLHRLVRRCHTELPFSQTYLFCTLGYATHGLLDTCTSYGTMLFWPFSDERFSWSVISIIDPLFTIPVLTLVILAARRQKPLLARMALAWAAFYLALGVWQNHAAITMGAELAQTRGHTPLRVEAKPSFANMLVWKTIYETKDRFYVDAVRTGVAPRVFKGTSVRKLDAARDFPWLDPASQQAEDIKRFSWFSDGFVAKDPDHPDRVIDVRYSFLPNDIRALWSIRLDRDASQTAHVRFLTHRGDAPKSLRRLWRMIWAE